MTFRRLIPALFVTLLLSQPATAATINVPKDHKTIQAAIDATRTGDTVLVAAGTYKERIRLQPCITVKSAGDETAGKLGLRRAEMTIIDGGGKAGKGPGVQMAEGATLDGFTVMNVGLYDDAEWKKHHATHGEEQSHEHIGHFGTPGIGITGVNCTVRHNNVHHNGYTGIAIQGVAGRQCSPLIEKNVCYRNMGGGIGSVKQSTAVIRANICFQNFFAGIGHDNASPLVEKNICYENVRAGIGISEGAKPVVRSNRCYRNRRAGIGIRTGEETSPLVIENDCYENEMAGIGNRDHATPIIRGNRCYKNKMAGIGSRDGARAVIEKNECYENEMAGIGSRLGAAPVIRNNKCYRNKMAGIGAREKSTPVIEGNECYENGMAGIGNQSEAAPVVRDNRCYKNGMAGIGSRSNSRPVIVGNDCYENKLAGIGSREGAMPIIRGNRCYKNEQAGIGSRLGARPVIVENESRENKAAGIGVRTNATAIIIGNRCLENRLVAIGVPDGATAYIHGNELKRTEGGAPSLVAIRGGSTAVFSGNSVRGGGVAGLLVQGNVRALGNRFEGRGPKKQGSAIWVWDKSNIIAADNRVDGYRNAVNASGSAVTAANNLVSNFQGTAINVRKPSGPIHVTGTTAVSSESKNAAANIDGKADSTNDNRVITPGQAKSLLSTRPKLWYETVAAKWLPSADGKTITVQDGPWKLLITNGPNGERYRLYNTETDPDQKSDLSKHLEQIVFRLRGLHEQNESRNDHPKVRPSAKKRK